MRKIAEERSVVLLTTGAGILLLVAAWSLSSAPFLPKTEDLEAHFSSSSGVAVLHGGALPWLVQFAGLAALFVVTARFFLGNRTYRTVCVALPLLVGLFWWSGLVLKYWGTDRLGLVTDVSAYELGSGSLFDDALFAVGALVHPMRLHGPFTLSGVEFFWTGLSTALVLFWLGIGIAWLSRTTPKEKLDRKGWLRVGLVVSVYTPPMYLRAARSLFS